jgi:hypothetical protein
MPLCMAFCLLYFRQLVTIRTTHSYKHFARHYKFDYRCLLKQPPVIIMFFLTDFRGVNVKAEKISAWSMTLLKRFQQGNWPRWNSNIVDFLGEYDVKCETALSRESGPYVGLTWKKTEGRKYRYTVPLSKLRSKLNNFFFSINKNLTN